MAGYQPSDAIQLVSRFVHWADDEEARFGNTYSAPNVRMLWETADANANGFVISLPSGDATDVPVLAVGEGIRDVDLGMFDGFTQPMIATIDSDRDSYVGFHYSADDVAVVRMRLAAAGTVRSHTLPNVASDTFTLNDATQTLTNKTLTTGTTVQVDSGTAAAPTLSFNADTDTGWYRSAADEVSLTLGGGQEYTWTTADLNLRNNTLSNIGAAGNDWAADSLTMSNASGASNMVLTVENTSNNAATAEHSYIDLRVGGTTTTGDPHVRWTIPGGTSWHMGPDNSSSDSLLIGTGTAVGTNNIVRIDSGFTSQAGEIFRLMVAPPTITIASGGSATFTSFIISGITVNFTGTTSVTDLGGNMVLRGPLLAGDTATLTIDKWATLTLAPPREGTNIDLTAAAGIRITNATSGTPTNQYGIYIESMTAGTSDFGLAIEIADTATLWLGAAADSTTAAGGIAFGLSRDTNLYRSAANVLTTDDSFSVGAGLKILSAGAGEIGIQVSNASYTVGSEGSIVVPINAGAGTDALFGDTSGAHGLDTTNSRAYWRTGTVYKSVAIAGFQFPKLGDDAPVLGVPGDYDETICPMCGKQMTPQDSFGLVGDRWYHPTRRLGSKRSHDGLHSYGAHLGCTLDRVERFTSLEERVKTLEDENRRLRDELGARLRLAA